MEEAPERIGEAKVAGDIQDREDDDDDGSSDSDASETELQQQITDIEATVFPANIKLLA